MEWIHAKYLEEEVFSPCTVPMVLQEVSTCGCSMLRGACSSRVLDQRFSASIVHSACACACALRLLMPDTEAI